LSESPGTIFETLVLKIRVHALIQSQMMDNNNINYFEESEILKPKQVKILLIGEAPPPSGKRYFYIPRPMSNQIAIEADRSLPATIFNHYFQRRPETIQEYVNLLNRLKDMGIFLMDIVDMPIRIRDRKAKSGINQKNLQILKNEIPKLREKISSRGISIDDNKMIFLIPRPHYKKEIKREFQKAQIIRWIDFRLTPENVSRKKEILSNFSKKRL